LIKETAFGKIIRIMMGRDLDGAVLYWTTAYLVDGLLIDTGCTYTAEELIKFLHGLKVDKIVNTHHHEDHVGGNALLQKKRGPELYAHHLTIPLINRRLPLNKYQELVWGYPQPSVAKPLLPEVRTAHHNFRVIETPGHCPDHVSLYEPEQGWLFSGDLFVSETQKVFRADEDILTILSSLQRLLELPGPELTIFTSIGEVFTTGRSSILAFLDYIEEVRTKALQLSSEGHDAVSIRDTIFKRESIMAKLTEGHYSVLNLIRGLLTS
jgi:glyoxylase-like metal-dependent hydrolase (beta-lactamase superfamily II)